MGAKSNSKNNSEAKKIKCRGQCGRELTLSSSNFFKSNNPEFAVIDNFAPYCKGCLRSRIFDRHGLVDVDKLKDTLRILDKPFIRKVFDDVLSKGKFTLGDYNSQLNFGVGKGRQLTYADSDKEDNINKIAIKNNEEYSDVEDDGIEIQMLKDKWGDDLPKVQLVWMDRQYKKWENDYAIDNELDDTIIEQIIFEKWYIQKERQEGKPVDKRIETMNKLLKQGNFKKRSNEDNDIDSIAVYIAEWEKGKPFIKKSNTPEFQDPDNFIKLAEVLAGATARTIGRSNGYTAKFDEYYKNVTLDLKNLEEVNTDEEIKDDKS